MEWTRLRCPLVVDLISSLSKSSLWHHWLATSVSRNWLLYSSKGFGSWSCIRWLLYLSIHAPIVYKLKTVLQCLPDLQPLLVPESHFALCSIGFTKDSSITHRCNMILTCLDCFTKYTMLISCKMQVKILSVAETVQLFFTCIVKYFTVNQAIISDSNPHFVA